MASRTCPRVVVYRGAHFGPEIETIETLICLVLPEVSRYWYIVGLCKELNSEGTHRNVESAVSIGRVVEKAVCDR